jgi:hypothetical protein
MRLQRHQFWLKVVVDGEVIGTTPVEIECIPNGLTVYAPQMERVQPLEKLAGLPNLTILQRRGYCRANVTLPPTR